MWAVWPNVGGGNIGRTPIFPGRPTGMLGQEAVSRIQRFPYNIQSSALLPLPPVSLALLMETHYTSLTLMGSFSE